MKKLVLVLMVVFTAANAFAEDKKENILKQILETSISPIETVLGPITELEKIVVTPSRMEEKLAASSCSVSIVDSKDFDQKKIDAVKNALQDQVGLDIVQSGSFQGQTSLFTRGGNSNHTLILIDGVKAYDPISPNGAYNLAHLTLDNVDKIEILRGPQSALYGSDAMSGVVSITSKKATKPYVEAFWEGGSFYTYREHVEAGSVAHGFHYTFSASRLDTKGISQAQAKKNNQERDPYDNTSIAGRVDYDINDKASIGATLRYNKAHYSLDQGADADDDNASEIDKETFITLYGGLKVFDWWSQNLKLGWFETMRLNYDDDSPGFDFVRSKYSGRYFKLDYQNTFSPVDFDKFIIGYDYNEEFGQSYSQNDYFGYMAVSEMPKVFSREGGLYLENRLNIADRLTSTQGFRVNHHSRAGTYETYRIDASYLFASGTKVRGLVATGFKAPTLYQLFAPSDAYFGGGNPDLKPEKSFSYEYGMDQYLYGDKVIVGVTYFYTLYRDLIDSLYNTNTWVSESYINIGKAQVHGIETSVKVKPVESLTVNVGYTYQKTKDFQTDQELPRRPGNKFFVECFWQATKKLSFESRVTYTGPASDNKSNPDWSLNTYKVKEHTVVDMVANYDITKNFSVYCKINNLFNKYYEEVRGYTMAPFSAYGGVKAKF